MEEPFDLDQYSTLLTNSTPPTCQHTKKQTCSPHLHMHNFLHTHQNLHDPQHTHAKFHLINASTPHYPLQWPSPTPPHTHTSQPPSSHQQWTCLTPSIAACQPTAYLIGWNHGNRLGMGGQTRWMGGRVDNKTTCFTFCLRARSLICYLFFLPLTYMEMTCLLALFITKIIILHFLFPRAWTHHCTIIKQLRQHH